MSRHTLDHTYHATYKEHYACFKCRKMFRKPSYYGYAKPVPRKALGEFPCPQCSTPMSKMGIYFKPPRQSNVKQWKKVELLYNNGYAFHACGRYGTAQSAAG